MQKIEEITEPEFMVVSILIILTFIAKDQNAIWMTEPNSIRFNLNNSRFAEVQLIPLEHKQNQHTLLPQNIEK